MGRKWKGERKYEVKKKMKNKSFIQVKEKKIENIASAMSMVSQFMDQP